MPAGASKVRYLFLDVLHVDFSTKSWHKNIAKKGFKKGGREHSFFCKKKTKFIYIYVCNLMATGIVF